MKKVLIITYYWPPSGGAGVQRWLKFAKYLPSFNWKPVVYTPENPEAPAEDSSLLKEIPDDATVLKTTINEPYRYYRKLVGMKSDEKINAGFLSEKKKPGLPEQLAVWLRGNFFIPDARKNWIRPSVNYLSSFLDTHPVDVIVSTGPPHSMHLIAYHLKKKTNLPWIADFRDPWTGIDYYHHLRLTCFANRKHHKLEQKVLQNADRVICIGESIKQEFASQTRTEPVVITNGFDEEDFTSSAREKRSEKFVITHIGSLNKDRNHPIFWQVLSELLDENPDLKESLSINLIGKIDHTVSDQIALHNLSNWVDHKPYIPHRQIADELERANLLYLPVNNTPNAPGILTGKLFEYLASGVPIIAIGPEDGEMARIINKSNVGVTVGFQNRPALKKAMYDFIYKTTSYSGNMPFIQSFSRKALTGKLVQIMDSISQTIN